MTRILGRRDWHFARMTDVVQGSEEWARHKTEGKRMGSSQAAAVFPGVSTTTSTRDLIAALYGYAQTPCADYARDLMRQGQEKEPVLRDEAYWLLQGMAGELLCGCVPTQFQLPDLTCGWVQESSSPDLIVRDTNGNTALVELKWRAASVFDCGWDDNNSKLGLTVWCQIQHQMFVTGIDVGYVYSGANDGSRRMWRVEPSARFREMFEEALDHIVNADEERKNPYARGAKAKLRAIADTTIELVHRQLPQIEK